MKNIYRKIFLRLEQMINFKICGLHIYTPHAVRATVLHVQIKPYYKYRNYMYVTLWVESVEIDVQFFAYTIYIFRQFAYTIYIFRQSLFYL